MTPRDLRLPVLAGAAWAAQLAVPYALSGAGGGRFVVAGALVLVGVMLLGCVLAGRGRATAVALLLVIVGAGAVAVLHAERVRTNPVAELAHDGAFVRFTATVTSAARPIRSEFQDRLLVEARITAVTGRGASHTLRTPVLVLGSERWAEVELGTTVAAGGELAPPDDGEVAALVIAGDPAVLEAPKPWWRASSVVRASIRDAVAHRPPDQAALVPALVAGDDGDLPDELAGDFRTTGLSHLLAVSGTNLTLVVGFLLVVARWCGVRGRWLYVVGAAGILGFLVLARTEPSVVRAAAMGAVGLIALGQDGRQRGLRGLGAAVLALLLIDPGWARSIGFALSVAATAGILLVAPAWRDALARWLPRWLAEAIAIPAAAQLAVTPLVAGLSAEVSLVAVLANLLAEPAVAPATVLGLLGGLLALIWLPAGQALGTPAGWCVGWIVAVAERCADLPMPGVAWGSGAIALAVLAVVCAVIALGAPALLRHRWVGLGCAALMVVVVTVRVPIPGPASGEWVLAMCDVGQGDAMALATGPGSAVVVDAGPEPEPVRECLDDLGVNQVPLFVVTHFHADHVGGAAGVLAGRDVGAVWTSPLRDPPGGVAALQDALAAESEIPVEAAPFGQSRQIGRTRLQVLWPPPGTASDGPDDGSTANDTSVVLVAEVDRIRVLLTGDLEPPAQAGLARLAGSQGGGESGAASALGIDVLKVPHHGSPHQDLDWLTSLDPEIALVSVGAENDYGHPSPPLLDSLARAGIETWRTDEGGTLLVVADDGEPGVRSR